MSRNEQSKKHNASNGVHHVMAGEAVNDLEDFGNKTMGSLGGPRPIIRHYEAKTGQQSVKPNGQLDSEQQHNDHSSKLQPHALSQQNETSEIVDRTVDYQGWLQIKKRKWKDILESRKKQR